MKILWEEKEDRENIHINIGTKECSSNWCVKNRKLRNEKQRYLCKKCGKNFTIKAERLKKSESLKEQALKMIAEIFSVFDVSRTLNVSP